LAREGLGRHSCFPQEKQSSDLVDGAFICEHTEEVGGFTQVESAWMCLGMAEDGLGRHWVSHFPPALQKYSTLSISPFFFVKKKGLRSSQDLNLNSGQLLELGHWRSAD